MGNPNFTPQARSNIDSPLADKSAVILDEIADQRRALSERHHGAASPSPVSDFEIAEAEIFRKPTTDPFLITIPIFIVAHRRSGTTLLRWLLNAHPRLASVPENEMIKQILGGRSAKPHIFYSSFRSLEAFGEQRSTHLVRYAKLIDGVFRDYAIRQGKQRWVDKESFIENHLDALDSIFDYRAMYLYMIRHGLDVAFSASMSDRYNYEGGLPSLSLEKHLRTWVNANETLADFWSCNTDRCFLVRYEDLVKSPETTATKILQALGESWIPTLIDDIQLAPKPPGPGDYKIWATGGKIHTDSINRWPEWPRPLLTRLGRIANPTLQRLGYPAIG
jgi:protein-tyrosine sulfotransferase